MSEPTGRPDPSSTRPGWWPSPLSAADVAAHPARPSQVELVPSAAGPEVWWSQPCPEQGGRTTVRRRTPDGRTREVLDVDALGPDWNARNRVHEYGGTAWTVLPEGTLDGPGTGPWLVLTRWSDQRLWLVDAGWAAEPVALTPAPDRPAGLRYAEPVLRPGRGEIVCVREHVTGDAPGDVERDLVTVPLDGSGDVRSLTSSHRFLACPQPSPDGRYLAWIGWDHPDMPWDQAVALVAEVVGDGTLGPARELTGPRESVCQLLWAGDRLLGLTDPDGFWGVHDLGVDGPRRALHVATDDAGGPLWRSGSRWAAVLDVDPLRLAVLHGDGPLRLAVLVENPSGTADLDDLEPTSDCWGSTLAGRDGLVAGTVASADADAEVRLLDLTGGPTGTQAGADPVVTRVTRAAALTPDDALWLPTVVHRVDGDTSGRPLHSWAWGPRHPDRDPGGAPVPWVVFVHGGPTGRSEPVLDPEVVFFTSRGFGVLDVQYGGSAGFGRAYRERLAGGWGVVDVQDVVVAAWSLVADGLADPERLAVRGGSAGGWTTVAAMTSGDAPFAAGTARYPITDLLDWAGDSHDFEARYLDGLVGPLPETAQTYRDRSPLLRADRTRGEVLLMHGTEDVVVPPAHSRRFAAALADHGLPHTLLELAGEQHGFRADASVRTALEAELDLYRRTIAS